ncbi:hypothetical protein N7509_011336 [Penicillium cosmopolitanum]|uniref:Protein trafficking Pga2 n=1 Tax=Penicillium cosmopolitanum TaxID=1131564 RepID=A0A9W9VTD1_9EURO|nr:uncharacterized protein N7509_011336 [Penicillium cosmopolitanum]KAJ5388795.1 hypothetical protein N7509_011336 [Penicillium cosmopolitanum]
MAQAQARNEQADISDKAVEAATDFFHQIYSLIETVIKRFFKNSWASVAEMSGKRWTKVILSVVFYLCVRPYIEKLFKWMHDRDRKKEKAKKEAERAAFGKKKAKVSPNALRGGESGKVLGEVEDSDDDLVAEEGEEDTLAAASGVPEWHGMARKRQKKYIKNLQKQGQKAEKLSEEQIMELLDWSDEEAAKKDA